MKKLFVILILIACAGGGWYWWKRSHAEQGPTEVFYRTSPIEKRTITQIVSATGTIKAIQEVEVGTQVTGKIVKLLADFNSKVDAGQTVAMIDPETYEASAAAAEAQLISARATLTRTEVSLKLAEKELVRNEALLKKNMISESDYDSSLAERDGLKAQLMGNQASVKQAEANVKQAKTNLDYCTIISPVTGVVLDRKVDEGQTVVSSMNASTLFKIATDLSRIEVQASIPEADIGQLKVGQTVNFTVDAYRQTFTGKVKQIRMSAASESNVVTYPVIVEAENPDCKLFPGMTATLSVIVASEEDIWAVPTAAIRFKPADKAAPEGTRCIWIARRPTEIEAIPVKLGVSDSIYQQVICEQSLEGLNVATGVMTADERNGVNDNQVTNPFMMRPPGRNNSKSGGKSSAPQGPPPPGP